MCKEQNRSLRWTFSLVRQIVLKPHLLDLGTLYLRPVLVTFLHLENLH